MIRLASHGFGLPWATRELELELIGTNLRGRPKYNYCPVDIAKLVYEDYKRWFFWLVAANLGWILVHALRFTWMLEGQIQGNPTEVWLAAISLGAGIASLWRMMQRKQAVILQYDLQD